MKNIKIKISNFNKKIISLFDNISYYINKIFTYKFKNNTFNKTSNFNKVLIFLISILFLYLFYLSIPSLYNKGKLQKDLSDKLLSEFKINFSISSEINYSILPSPHFLVENAKIFDDDQNLPKEISQIKKLKIFISQKKLFDQKNIIINKVLIQDANFSIQKKHLKFFNDYKVNKFSEKKLFIKKSNIFYKNKDNEAVALFLLQDLELSYDKKKSLNKIKSNGTVFNVPLTINWNKNFKDKKSFSLFKSKKLMLEMKNTSFTKGDNKIIENDILSLNNKISSIVELKKNSINFFSNKNKIKNNSLVYKGKINLEPFDFQLGIDLEKINIDKLLSPNFLFLELLKTDLLFNKNLSTSISLNSKKITKNKLFDSCKIIFNINNGKIDLNKSSLISKKIGSLNLSNSQIRLIDKKLKFRGSFNFDIKDQKEFYRIFLIPKVNRTSVQKIYFDLEADIFENRLKIYNFAINEKNSELNDSIEIFLKNYGKNIKIDNWIDLKNLTNLIFKSYTG